MKFNKITNDQTNATIISTSSITLTQTRHSPTQLNRISKDKVDTVLTRFYVDKNNTDSCSEVCEC